MKKSFFTFIMLFIFGAITLTAADSSSSRYFDINNGGGGYYAASSSNSDAIRRKDTFDGKHTRKGQKNSYKSSDRTERYGMDSPKADSVRGQKGVSRDNQKSYQQVRGSKGSQSGGVPAYQVRGSR